MIRNRASPSSSPTNNGMDVALLLAADGSSSPSQASLARQVPARTNSDKYHHTAPRGGSGSGSGSGMNVWLIVLLTCCCCTGIAVVVGGMGFMVASGMIHFNVDFRNIHIHTGGGDTNFNSNPQEPTPLLTEEERKQQLVDMAKKIAQDHHEKDQIMMQQAQLEQEQHNLEANPSLAAKKSGGIKGVNNNKQQQQQQAAKPGEKQVVRDQDGDIVTDDMLIKDMKDHIVEIIHTDEDETDILDGENRWDKSDTKIPQWLKDYFVWHNQIVPTLIKSKGDPLDWRSHSYIVMTCLGGEVCGNVAHRLRPLMAMLRVAADSKRIFFIHWDLPDRLEKFLQPHQKGGINWVVPEFMMWKVRKSPPQNDMAVIHQQAFQDDRRVVNCMYNDDTFAEQYYNERRRLEGEEAIAAEAFRDVWNVLFKPTYLLQDRLDESLRLMGLEAGEYASAHIDYEVVPRDEEEKEDLRKKVENAMNCMSNLRPGGPFLVAAQTYAIAREAIVYGKHHGVKVHAKQIAHDTSVVPKDLYTSFVEILLMASSRCVAYNKGGYGQLGYMLGYDYDCKIKYTEPTTCEWKDPQVGV